MVIYPEWTEQEKQILRDNVNAMSYERIAGLLPGRTREAVKRRAALLGISRDSTGSRFPKRTLNETFFSHPYVLPSYWAGFIAADGCIVTDPRREVRIGIHVKDKSELKRFISDAGFNGPISDRNNTSYICICAADQWIHDLWSVYRIGPRKTMTLEPPLIASEAALSYSIGFIDGDGCWHREPSGRLHLIIVGTKSILEWIRDQWVRHGAEVGNTVITFKRNCWRLHISGRYAASVADLLKSIPVARFERKWNIAYGRKVAAK